MSSASEPCLLVVEADVLVRTPLAEYLRDCGYRVLETVDAAEARRLLGEAGQEIEAVLVGVAGEGPEAFALAAWIRRSLPEVEVILAGSVAKVAERAGDLCEDGPGPARSHDYHRILDHIRRLLAARERDRRDR